MKISGIICEYNPFHSGHLYHIRETRKNGATHIIAVMSGNFVQRGDVAIMDKLERAKLAVKSGVDLVIELPVQYCLSSAESFASGAVWLLESLGVVDELSFGSECGSIEKLEKAMSTVEITAISKVQEIRSIMEKGYTYPKALSSVINGFDPQSATVLSEPNNMLAIEYLRALSKFASDIKPFTVQRITAGHDSTSIINGGVSSTYIREQIEEKHSISTVSRFLLPVWRNALADAVAKGETASIKRLERVLLYKLRTSSPDEIALVNDVGQGLENRIYNARKSGSLDELFFTIKTKRYTMARIRRILLSFLIGINKSDMELFPPFCRILAFNEKGTEILAKARKSAVIPFGSSIAKLSHTNEVAERFAELEIKASDVYGLALETINSAQKDYRAKIMIDME